LRTANTRYTSAAGFAGVYAPGVSFVGPVYVGNIAAYDDAIPALIMNASASATQICGGDFDQPNERAVQVSGLGRVEFVAGTSSHGVLYPAQPIKARFERDGVDVTDQIVGNPF
jgi:hypothetical protein